MRRQPEAPDEVRWDPADGQLDPRRPRRRRCRRAPGRRHVGRRWTEAYKRKILDSRVAGHDAARRSARGARSRDRTSSSPAAPSASTATPVTPSTTSPGRRAPVSSPTSSASGRRRRSPRRGRRHPGRATSAPASCSPAKGGILPPQRLAWKLGLGARIGSGRAVAELDHADDEVARHPVPARADDISGPVNLVAPEPVTQKQFGQALAPRAAPADALGHPGLRAPARAQRIRRRGPAHRAAPQPRVLEDAGFTFGARTFDEGLRAGARRLSRPRLSAPLSG